MIEVVARDADLLRAACVLPRMLHEISDAVMDGGDAKSRREVRFSGPGVMQQDQVICGFQKGGACQLLDRRLQQRRFRPIDPGQGPMHRTTFRFKLIAQASNLAIGQFSLDQPVQPGFKLPLRPIPDLVLRPVGLIEIYCPAA